MTSGNVSFSPGAVDCLPTRYFYPCTGIDSSSEFMEQAQQGIGGMLSMFTGARSYGNFPWDYALYFCLHYCSTFNLNGAAT